ncbi:hypothetical protein M514_18829 [Trichuris suis]|uniref:Uncharacterized protein n=1 Tax=Trichuris suis TaxID=68888 RepID=A0A085NHT0_9BILA
MSFACSYVPFFLMWLMVLSITAMICFRIAFRIFKCQLLSLASTAFIVVCLGFELALKARRMRARFDRSLHAVPQYCFWLNFLQQSVGWQLPSTCKDYFPKLDDDPLWSLSPIDLYLSVGKKLLVGIFMIPLELLLTTYEEIYYRFNVVHSTVIMFLLTYCSFKFLFPQLIERIRSIVLAASLRKNIRTNGYYSKPCDKMIRRSDRLSLKFKNNQRIR